nr:ribonuclease H-like domain-containing protein [Tanacetum cinerariifolium]
MNEIYSRLDGEQSERKLLAGRLNMLFRDRCAHAYTRHLMETEARLSREAWEVIINGYSPVPTIVVDGVIQPVSHKSAEQKVARRNELKAHGTLLMALPDKHQLKFNSHKDAKTLMEAIEKRFRGNTETVKVQKTLLKQQFENFTGSSSENLDQIHDRLQKLVNQLETHGMSMSQEDVNLKFLRSLPSEWKTHTLIWRNKADLEEHSLDDLFNISAATSVSVVCAKLHVSSHPNIDSLSNAVIFLFFASQSTSPQLDNEDLKQIDVDDLEEMDLRWQMAMLTMRARRKGHFARECRSPKDSIRSGATESQRRTVLVENPTSNALVSQCDGLESVEARLVVYKQNESILEVNIKLLNVKVQARDTALVSLRQKLNQAELEKDDLKLKLDKFQTSSKNLTELLASQTNEKHGLGYFSSKSDSESLSPSSPSDRLQPSGGYHASVPSFVQSTEQVKTLRHSVQPVVAPILDATLKSKNPKSNSSSKRKNRKTCFVCRSVDHLIKDCNPQYALKDKGVIDSGCSRHMTGNMSYLSDFKELNGGYVAFGGNPKGGKILGKGKIKTSKLDFEDVYFVNDLKFNIFSVSQMCDKKNKVLFIDTECLVLSPDFKLRDESQVLLRVPRENNMYNVNLKNIVPSGDLTCLFAKETIDESNLWHRRLGVNKLVKDVNLKFLRSLPYEWKTHTLIWRNKADLEEQSLDDLFNSLKIYETEVKQSSSISTASQNLAFVSTSYTDNTTDSVSAAASVSAACAKLHASPLPNVDSLSNVVIYSFFSSQSTSPHLDNEDLKQIDVDDLEEIDLRWQMAMLTMRARRECWSPKDSRRTGTVEPQRRTIPVETSIINALVSQYDGLESVEAGLLVYKQNESVFEENIKLLNIELQLRDTALVTLRQKLEKAEQERDDLKLKLEKFQTSSKNLTELLASHTNEKTSLVYNSQVFTRVMFDCDDYFSSESDCESWTPSSLYDRFQPNGEYHLSPTKPDQDLSHTTRPTTPIIEDWVSDSKNDSETKAPQIVPSFVRSSEQVKYPRHSVQSDETSIAAATPKPASPRSASSGKRKNRKACFVCKSVDHLIKDCDYHAKKMAQPTPRNYAHKGNQKKYALLTHIIPQKHMVPTVVLTQSKPVFNAVVRPVSAAVPKINVTRPRYAHLIVTKSKSPIRRHITRSPSQKTSNSPPRVTAVQATVVLFSVSQMCDKKNSVLFTDTECLVLSPDFKLPNESQVLLRVPRENNMYNVNLKNIVPSGNLTCLFAKATIDESNLWHRRLGHINFKTKNKLNNDADAAFDGKEHDFDAKKPEFEVILSPSSSAQSRKQDDKTKKEAKGKSLVESVT